MWYRALCLCVFAASAAAQPAPRVSADLPPAERTQLEQVRRSVWVHWFGGDTASLRRILAPELVAISPEGRQSLTQTLAGSAGFRAGGGRLVSLDFADNVFQRMGDVVVLFSRYALVTEGGGRQQAQQGQVTEVFVRRDGRWVHTSWHLDNPG